VVNRRPRQTPAGYRELDSAKELFAAARRAIYGGGEHTVRYLPRRGLPRSISNDPIIQAVDDEYSYTVSELRITRRYPKR
jgi:hypothetical protein